jgi:hypothetical protein
MRALLAPAAALLALAGPVTLTSQASAESTTLKAVIFEEVKPPYHKTDAGYEGLGVDVLEQIRIQAKRRKVADQQLQPPVGTCRMFGPFQQVPGKSISQVNFRIGANNDPQPLDSATASPFRAATDRTAGLQSTA